MSLQPIGARTNGSGKVKSVNKCDVRGSGYRGPLLYPPCPYHFTHCSISKVSQILELQIIRRHCRSFSRTLGHMGMK